MENDDDVYTINLELLSEWESCLDSPTVSASQLYRLGRVLHALRRDNNPLAQPYHELLTTLPLEHRQGIFHDIKTALIELLSTRHEDSRLAVQSLSSLYHHSTLAASAIHWETNELHLLASASDVDENDKIIILSSYILQIHDIEELLHVLHTLREESCWNALLEYQPGWRAQITQQFKEQEDYIETLLLPNISEQNVKILADETSVKQPDRQSVNNKISPSDALQQRIDQIREVLPHLGEGYIEAVLSFFKGDVEQTIAALFDENNVPLPASLQILDPSLPRRHRADARSKEEEEESKRIAKLALQQAMRQQEEEAFALDRVMKFDEYDDDYDDQYDDMDGGIGEADAGLYESYEDIMIYNRALKDVEAEQSFWEENRNTNQRKSVPKSDDVGEKSYRGPDKIKGGRIASLAKETKVSSEENQEAPPEEADKPQKETEKKGPNLKSKSRKMSNRRSKQKDANAKRGA